MVKILLVDDHQIFLDGLKALLQDEPLLEITSAVSNGQAALDYLSRNQIDLVILDISMPLMSGSELNRQIKQKYPHIKTLALTSHGDNKMISELTQSKVNGYLLKDTEKSELLEAIHKVSEGGQYFSEHVKEVVLENFFSPKDDPSKPELSNREIEILRLIAEEFTAQEIADKLFISQHTVNTHRKNLLSKLHVKNVAGLVKYAYENNLL